MCITLSLLFLIIIQMDLYFYEIQIQKILHLGLNLIFSTIKTQKPGPIWLNHPLNPYKIINTFILQTLYINRIVIYFWPSQFSAVMGKVSVCFRALHLYAL